MTETELWNLCRAKCRQVRHMSSKRTSVVVLSDRGVEYASKTTLYKRNKIEEELFVFTEAGEALATDRCNG
jgi:hypothetical protein